MIDIFSFLPILIFMPFFATIFVLMSKKEQPSNIYNVCMLAITSNLVIVLRFFHLIDTSTNSLQLITKIEWLKHLNISFVFGTDVFSLFLILAVHIVFLIILSVVKTDTDHPKTLATFSMIFLSMITGLLISCDLFSFYLFFEAILIPLFLLIGISGGLKKQGKVSTFLLYNMFFSLLLFVAIILLFNYNKEAYIMSNVHNIGLSSSMSYFIWGAIFLSLLSRLPIWPFHRMLSSITAELKNPLVFLIANLTPLTAIYGFARLFPEAPEEINLQIVLDILIIITMISMLFISLIAFAHKDFQYKIFSYVSIVYLFYLVSIFCGDDRTNINISLSFFGFILATAGVKILWKQYIDNNHSLSNYNRNIFKFFLFCLLGAPLSSMFLNNLSILSSLYQHNITEACIVFLTFVIVGASLIDELIKVKISSEDKKKSKLLIFVCFILLMSFVRPLWFVEL
ncbi:MAG: proton-conducting transporter membrane subunit [Alphaproteobacteria bacterium]